MSERWGGDDRNIYYNPKACGLEIVAQLSDDESYQFNIALLLRNTRTGSLWLASDSGCSCPTPFEDFRSFEDLTPARTIEAVERVIGSDGYGWSLEDRNDFKRKARAALRKHG